ncbi:FHA domain-containing protein [Scytonema hofmannii FACHB-248]|uniref:FHA domain-containing protein n=1 Tax=Scytonema hofmannii FACHB-248 TaxID=1842502 RepID=A0ABR8GMR7_9CYAN|nr:MULTISPECIES: FHA domain-containing protein [Nostocales]MBD2604714.1 FHA domain-containing protein [Scytonema hofmannii FACHB-248]
MIVCPNCNHPNPDGAVQCEACYTPLPATSNCPSCGAIVQADAAFCGQCGYNLHATAAVAATVAPEIPLEVQPSPTPDPLLEYLQPEPLETGENTSSQPDPSLLPPTMVAAPPESSTPDPEPFAAPEPVAAATEPVAAAVTVAKTQLQQVTARLIHVQSDREIELPQSLSVIHIGKPNDRIPPDIDVSGFTNSEVVSRIHADIRLEGDAHYIEDVGSSNGTYINNLPLLPGNRHRLRPGDRISLGKGDMVTFLFQIS